MWDIGFIDIIDILIVAWGMYWLYRRTQQNGTHVIFYALFSVIFVWLIVSQVVQMRLLGAILDSLISVGLIALVIIFQTEIRLFLLRLGSRNQWHTFLKFFNKNNNEADDSQWVTALVHACQSMADQHVGALICIQQSDDLQQFVNTGERLDALVSSRLVEQIFFKNSPLHDGAMIISDGRIRAAACILPLSASPRIPKEFGLRHRSALGLAEQSDAKVIIVSEETGSITMAWRGRYYRDVDIRTLPKHLMADL